MLLKANINIQELHDKFHQFGSIPTTFGQMIFLFENQYSNFIVGEFLKQSLVFGIGYNFNENNMLKDKLWIQALLSVGGLAFQNINDSNNMIKAANPADINNIFYSDNILTKTYKLDNTDYTSDKYAKLENTTNATIKDAVLEFRDVYINMFYQTSHKNTENSLAQAWSNNKISVVHSISLLYSETNAKDIYALYKFNYIINAIFDKSTTRHSPILIIGDKDLQQSFIYMMHNIGNKQNINVVYYTNPDNINSHIEKTYAKPNYNLISDFISSFLSKLMEYNDNMQESFKALFQNAAFTKFEIVILKNPEGFDERNFDNNQPLKLETSKLLELLKPIKSNTVTVCLLDTILQKDPSVISRCGLQFMQKQHTYNDMLHIVKNIFMEELCAYVSQKYINEMNMCEIIKFVCEALASYYNTSIIRMKIEIIISYIISHKGIINLEELNILCA